MLSDFTGRAYILRFPGKKRRSGKRASMARVRGVVFDLDGTLVRLEMDFETMRPPRGLRQICEAWQLAPSEVIMVGDYLYDIQAGREAGMRTVLVSHGRSWPFAELADIVMPNFETISATLQDWFLEST